MGESKVVSPSESADRCVAPLPSETMTHTSTTLNTLSNMAEKSSSSWWFPFVSHSSTGHVGVFEWGGKRWQVGRPSNTGDLSLVVCRSNYVCVTTDRRAAPELKKSANSLSGRTSGASTWPHWTTLVITTSPVGHGSWIFSHWPKRAGEQHTHTPHR